MLTGLATIVTAVGTLVLAWPRPNYFFPATETPTSPPKERTLTSEPLITSHPVTEPPGIPPETAFPATAIITLTPLPKDFSDNRSPSAVMAGDRLTVFARSANGTLMHKFYEGGWTDWIPLGDGQTTSGPSAVMAGEQLTVFARGADGTLIHKFYDSGWTDWIPLGEGQITSIPQQ